MSIFNKQFKNKIYESWALLKKDEQIHDINKKERFDVTPDLPLKIIGAD